jgi:hypothetical protein
VSAVQLVGHEADEPLQTYAPHEGLPGLPVATGVHVPTLPVRLQASQAPLQAVLQQTPSTQLPLAHWLAEVQEPEPSLGTQVPPLQ